MKSHFSNSCRNCFYDVFYFMYYEIMTIIYLSWVMFITYNGYQFVVHQTLTQKHFQTKIGQKYNLDYIIHIVFCYTCCNSKTKFILQNEMNCSTFCLNTLFPIHIAKTSLMAKLLKKWSLRVKYVFYQIYVSCVWFDGHVFIDF